METSQSLFAELTDQINQDWDAASEWRQEAREDFRFAHGQQWTDAELKMLKEANREAVTFNRIAPAVRFIAGEEIKNRRELRFKPRTPDDQGFADGYNAGAERFRDECNAERLENAALQDALTCGVGYVDDRVDYMDDPKGTMLFEHIDPFEIVPDRHSHQSNLRDARRITRVRRIPMADAKEMFPGVALEDLSANWYRGKDVDLASGEERRIDLHGSRDAGLEGNAGDMATIAECQYWEREAFYEIALPSNQTMVLREDAWLELVDALGEEPPHYRFTERAYYRAFIGGQILEHELSPYQKGFTIKAITGYRDRQRGLWYGLVRSMRDPQRFYNRFLTTSLHIMQANAKGGVMAAEGATDNQEEFEDSWSAADGVVWLKQIADQGGRPMVQPKPQTAFPDSLKILGAACEGAFDQVSGMSAEARGQVDTVQSPMLSMQRRQSAMTVLQDIFDSLRAFRLMQGKTVLEGIQKYLADGRLIRAIGKDKGRLLPLLKAPETVEFDIVIDDAPSSPNEKERQWPIILEMLKLYGQTPPPEVLSEIIAYSPLNESLADTLSQAVQGQGPDPQQQALMQQKRQIAEQLALRQAQLELAKTEAEIQRLQAQAARDRAQAEDIVLQSRGEAMADIAGAQLDQARAQALGAAADAQGKMNKNAIDAARGQIDVVDRLNRALTPAAAPNGRMQ